MNKQKKLKKNAFRLDDLKPIKILDESRLHPSKASEAFKDKNEISHALLECLIDNDTESFIEILNAYLSVNKTHGTVTQTISGNPTLKTIAKIVHETLAIGR